MTTQQAPAAKPWAFILVTVILLSCALGLTTATNFMKLHFKKLPIPPARPLTDLPSRLGPWMQVSIDEPLGHEMLEALGTDKYVFRTYVDTRVGNLGSKLDQLKDRSNKERMGAVAAIQEVAPGAVINVALTYYTGLADTVAHIPERCYIADGYDVSKYDVVSWDAMKGRPGDEKARCIVFEDTTPGRKSVSRNVAYFFNCNGQYMNDSIMVRRTLADLFQTHGYYMKVEMQTFNLKPEEYSRVMNDFLTYLLPEAEKCLPDWTKVNESH